MRISLRNGKKDKSTEITDTDTEDVDDRFKIHKVFPNIYTQSDSIFEKVDDTFDNDNKVVNSGGEIENETSEDDDIVAERRTADYENDIKDLDYENEVKDKDDIGANDIMKHLEETNETISTLKPKSRRRKKKKRRPFDGREALSTSDNSSSSDEIITNDGQPEEINEVKTEQKKKRRRRKRPKGLKRKKNYLQTPSSKQEHLKNEVPKLFKSQVSKSPYPKVPVRSFTKGLLKKHPKIHLSKPPPRPLPLLPKIQLHGRPIKL